MKKLLLVLAAWLCLAVQAYAVELNTATQAELEALKGIGPVKSKTIIDERTKNGPFKDADDFATRVKGVGDKTVVSLEAQGLTINGSNAAPKGAPSGTMSAGTSGKTPGANVKAAPAAATMAPASTGPAAMASASAADSASAAAGKKSKKASKKAAASAASAASAAK